MVFEIIILAMVAAFLGLRLYSVLGRRAEHEEEHVPKRFEAPKDTASKRQAPPSAKPPVQPVLPRREMTGLPLPIEEGLRAIAAADRSFNLAAFMEGARGAYGMILEAFWRGDKDTLKELCDEEVYQGFASAIDEREAAGHVLDNRLVRIEEVAVHSADLDGRIARIVVRFTADIAAVTRDKDGNVIAGSLDDAVESRDIWTFARDISSAGPDWVLDETDEG